LLTSEDIKEILRKRIVEKNKKVNSHLYNLRQVEEALIELETYQSFLVDIMDEEARRKMRKNSKIKSLGKIS